MFRSRTISPALILGVPLALLAVAQAVPYGRAHTNPPDGVVTTFDSPETEALARRACFDCHSNRTRWPWYASIAPFSWRIQNHVDEGRQAVNFTAFEARNQETREAAREAGEEVLGGEMPPADYRLAHPEARLTAEERRTLAAGLARTFALSGGGVREAGGDGSRGRGMAGGGAREEERERAGDRAPDHDDDDDDRG